MRVSGLEAASHLERVAERRVLVLDGALGTEIARLGLGEAEYRGSRFARHPVPLAGDHDLLVLTAPSVVTSLHRAYLEVGCDVLKTATFNANRFSQAAYRLESLIYELNRTAAELARAVAAEFEARDGRARFVAGVLGPSPYCTPRGDGAPGRIAFREAYAEQARGLIDGGAELLLLETVTSCEALEVSLEGVRLAAREAGRQVPVSVSLAVVDAEGRTPSGERLEEFAPLLRGTPLFSAGLNCSLGATAMRPFLERLRVFYEGRSSVHPSAGLPLPGGRYALDPELFAEVTSGLVRDGLASVVGGCCGTTPEHLARLVERVRAFSPRG